MGTNKLRNMPMVTKLPVTFVSMHITIQIYGYQTVTLLYSKLFLQTLSKMPMVPSYQVTMQLHLYYNMHATIEIMVIPNGHYYIQVAYTVTKLPGYQLHACIICMQLLK